MTRILRHVDWTIRPDQDDDAPPITYAFRCLTLDPNDMECGATSGHCGDPIDAQAWTFQHLGEHPEHTSYAELIERPWVMWRGGPA